MNNFSTTIILNHSILIPALIGIYRFKQADKSFYPFMILVWLGLLNETLSLILAFTVKTNAVNSNIYVLLEYVLIIYQFYRWNDAFTARYIFWIASGLIVWVANNLLLHSLLSRNSIFRIFYSFIVIFFSIDQVNKLIAYERTSLFKNPVFLICLTFLVYYSSKAFVEVFAAFSLHFHYSFSADVFMILTVINFICNISYTISLLCIPPKLQFVLPY